VARYNVRLKASAVREIEQIEPKRARRQVVNRIGALADDPRPPGCEKLSGQSDRYRVRQGAYRIVNSVEDDVLVVYVVKVGHRSTVYGRKRCLDQPGRNS
jgi:mRNA interferase RelE/StbE